MPQLSRHELSGILDFIAFFGEAAELDDFAVRLAFGIDRLIPCRGASYNEINLARRRARWVSGIETGPEHVAMFEQFMPEHPILNHLAASPLSTAVKMSDFVSQPQWRGMGLYSAFYRPLGCESMLALEVSSEPISIDVALFRDGGADFSERDRALLTQLRPHLLNAYRNAAAMTDFTERLSAFEQGFDAAGVGIIELAGGERVRAMTETARQWLHDYFGASGETLPEAVLAWLRQSPVPVIPPLVAERDGRRLSLRLVGGAARRLILLREQRHSVTAEELAPLGLARRECEILAWVTAGKSDAEIANILALSPRTVSHTLERVYRKLGVTTRTAATAKALGVTES